MQCKIGQVSLGLDSIDLEDHHGACLFVKASLYKIKTDKKDSAR